MHHPFRVSNYSAYSPQSNFNYGNRSDHSYGMRPGYGTYSDYNRGLDYNNQTGTEYGARNRFIDDFLGSISVTLGLGSRRHGNRSGLNVNFELDFGNYRSPYQNWQQYDRWGRSCRNYCYEGNPHRRSPERFNQYFNRHYLEGRDWRYSRDLRDTRYGIPHRRQNYASPSYRPEQYNSRPSPRIDYSRRGERPNYSPIQPNRRTEIPTRRDSDDSSGKREVPPRRDNTSLTDTQAKIAQRSAEIAQRMTAERLATGKRTPYCALGVQQALSSVGIGNFLGTGDGWHMRRAIASSGKFQEIDPRDMREGDVIFRKGGTYVIKNGPLRGQLAGHTAIITGRDKNGFIESSDRTKYFDPNAREYTDIAVYRYKEPTVA